MAFHLAENWLFFISHELIYPDLRWICSKMFNFWQENWCEIMKIHEFAVHCGDYVFLDWSWVTSLIIGPKNFLWCIYCPLYGENYQSNFLGWFVHKLHHHYVYGCLLGLCCFRRIGHYVNMQIAKGFQVVQTLIWAVVSVQVLFLGLCAVLWLALGVCFRCCYSLDHFKHRVLHRISYDSSIGVMLVEWAL